MREDYSAIIVGSLLLISNMLNYLVHPSLYYYYVPLNLAILTYILLGVFEFKKYYNKNVYIAVLAVILVVMWVFSFIQPLFPEEDIVVYYIVAGLSTLIVLIILLFTLRRWMKNEKSLNEYDEALRISPNDITALNNKGAVLTIQRKYDDAMECFDRVLEIAPEDGIVLQNKNILEMKLQNKTFSKQVSDNPQLEIVEGEGKSILKIKKK